MIWKTRRTGNEAGLSLIELMVALTLFSMVMAAGLRFLTIQHRAAVILEDASESQQQLRAAMGFMVREIMEAGSGVPPDEAGIVLMGPEDIRFDSNLYDASGRLTRKAGAGQGELEVRFADGGEKFREGKTITICSEWNCERHRLARDARSSNLTVSGNLLHEFPSGSSVRLINHVEYVLKPIDGTEEFKVLRRVDNGVNAVAEGVESMRLEYFDREGMVTDRPADVRRIRVHLSARLPRNPDKLRSLESEVQLRN